MEEINKSRLNALMKYSHLAKILLGAFIVAITMFGNNTSYAAAQYKYNGMTYPNLESAINAVSSSGTIRITQEGGDDSEATIPSGKDIILDTAGLEMYKGTYPITINNGATLTIVGDGKIRTLNPNNSGNYDKLIDVLILNHGILRIRSKRKPIFFDYITYIRKLWI